MKKTALKKLAIATGVAAAIAAPASQASIIDNPFFRVLGVVIVWGADNGGASPIASDFVLMNSAGGSGTAGDDIIAGDVHAVVTGTLTAIPTNTTAGSLMDITNPTSGGVLTDAAGAGAGFLDVSDSLTAFGLDATTDVGITNSVTHSFYVASNTAFDIQAVTALDAASSGDIGGLGLAGIGYDLAVDVDGDDGLAYGGNAQDPSTGGTGAVTGSDLAAINGTFVFDGGRRTAASVGAIAGQSVRFDATYTLGGTAGYDLSQGTGLLSADVTYTIFVP